MQTFFLASLEALLGIPEYFGYLFVFVIGASIGSFLNVVIYRLPLMMEAQCRDLSRPERTLAAAVLKVPKMRHRH